ncbi:MAG: hypothetical protein HGA85_05835 [Nanoarchaeota archaeon]|nr:hypothetical protein [Nanoarchaeota archaeon]
MALTLEETLDIAKIDSAITHSVAFVEEHFMHVNMARAEHSSKMTNLTEPELDFIALYNDIEKAWSDGKPLFPYLNSNDMPIYLAYAQTFASMAVEFAKYLDHIHEIGPNILSADGLKEQLETFSKVTSNLSRLHGVNITSIPHTTAVINGEEMTTSFVTIGSGYFGTTKYYHNPKAILEPASQFLRQQE